MKPEGKDKVEVVREAFQTRLLKKRHMLRKKFIQNKSTHKKGRDIQAGNALTWLTLRETLFNSHL